MGLARPANDLIIIKSADEIALMRQAGGIVAEALQLMADAVRPGVTTGELDLLARDVIHARGGAPAFLNYRAEKQGVKPFPAHATIAVNEEIVHGIPGPRVLRQGDIVSLDTGAAWRGYHADAALTVAVGSITPEARALMDTAKRALEAGIVAMRPGARLWDVISTIQQYVESRGYGIVREYQGHGIGRWMHEPPSVPNYLDDAGPRPRNVELRPGMVLALEPMITLGSEHTRVLDDGWTVVTRDGGLSAHFEHTVAVTDDGPEILTVV